MTEPQRVAEHNLTGYNDDPNAFQLPKAPPVSLPVGVENAGALGGNPDRAAYAEGAQVLFATAFLGLLFVLFIILLVVLNALF